ncbi:MAG: AraC family transcriptional regulator ligand-binding domain-containing protein [Pseudomonas sp.]|uniref:helix-turn-helix transcriptional regulator n=1 Tax=Pseudomonas sp. TaxID=306 RepID=UPI003BB78537
MPLYEPFLSSRYVAPLLTILQRQHASALERILERAQLPASKLQLAGQFITYQEFDRLLCAAAAELQRDDLGFELGQNITIDHHAALGVALRQCRTADQLLRLVVRFSKLITNGFFFTYQRHADYGELLIRPAAMLSQQALYAMEELFAVSTHSDLTAMLEQAPGLEIFLSMPRPAHAERYARLRPTRFQFGANALPEVRCRLPAALLDKALRQPAGSPPRDGVELANQGCPNQRTKEYSQWLKMMLREAEGVQPRLAELAQMLAISPRSLNRYLQAEGTSLHEMSAQIRCERAMLLLAKSDEPISQIAYRLGYASPASFFTAFRKRLQMGPREYRQRAMAEAATAQ